MHTLISCGLPSPPSSSTFAICSTLLTLQRYSVRLRPSATEKEESHIEVDRGKALEALEKLDLQLESLAQQEEVLPKEKPRTDYPELDLKSDVRMSMRTDEMPEISGSFLVYAAGILIILTIVNNIIFNLYVKPSVDGQVEQASVAHRVALKDPSEL